MRTTFLFERNFIPVPDMYLGGALLEFLEVLRGDRIRWLELDDTGPD